MMPLVEIIVDIPDDLTGLKWIDDLSCSDLLNDQSDTQIISVGIIESPQDD